MHRPPPSAAALATVLFILATTVIAQESCEATRESLLSLCGPLCSPAPVLDLPNGVFTERRVPVSCPALLTSRLVDRAADVWPPPHSPPACFRDDFSLNSTIPLRMQYLLNRYSGGAALTNEWTYELIESWKSHCAAGRLSGTYGGGETNAVFQLLRDQMSLTGKKILVVGSEKPWLEACALAAGAEKIVTLEYGTIKSTHPQITAMLPSDIYANPEEYLGTFDTVLSYSSLEHSGLGRYGDAINPWGDVMTVARIWCMTKKEGTFFLGLPMRPDERIHYNAHRIYGPKLLTRLLPNWTFLGIHTCGPVHKAVIVKKVE